MTFETWMKEVDGVLDGICFLTSSDLPDYRYYDCFEAEMTPEETAYEALENADFPMDELE